MDSQHIKEQAAALLLERGVVFTIVDAPFLLKILRLNKLRINALKAGTIAEFSLIILSKQFDIRISDKEYLYKEMDSLCRAISIAILNSRMKIRLLSGIIAGILKWKIQYEDLVKILDCLIKIESAVDFMSITAFLNLQMTMLMSPKAGQDKEGS